MSISVGQTSKHGATGEITERISQVLPSAGQRAETRPVQQADDLGGYQRFGIAQQSTRLAAGRGREVHR
jgi:menaquinone-dependent protoporphyrinogen IX oxidase